MPNDDLNTRIGERVVEIRTLQGKTQQEIAEAVGIGRPSIANIEAGRGLSVETLVALAAALDVAVDALTMPGVRPSPWLELAKLNTAAERHHDEAANRLWNQGGNVLKALEHRSIAAGLRLAQENQLRVTQESRRPATAGNRP